MDRAPRLLGRPVDALYPAYFGLAADPGECIDVRRDLDAFLRRLVPEDTALYRHNDEGPDDMPAHIKSALTQTHLSIPVTDGRLQLGTWQGIFLLEHRASPHRRSLVLTLVGEKAA